MPCEIKPVTSPNFSPEKIPVEFLVLHYTACTLAETLRIFTTPEKQVCAHFVLDLDGTVYDLGGFWQGPILRGAHAGKSAFTLEGRQWEAFNKFSVGIEIINLNGNLFPYTDAQYDSLAKISKHLSQRFPALQNPNRVVGHEQIAGFRGKADPGLCFDWQRFFSLVYPGQKAPERKAVLSPSLLKEFQRTHSTQDLSPEEYAALSSQLEAYVAKQA